MANTKSTAQKRKNSVHITGYLKENTLEQMKDKNGGDIIRGALTIAVDEVNSYRLSFYSKKLRKDGSESKDYGRLLKLLPVNTITIASYLKDNATANFATAANAATKVWARGSMEEYVYMKDDKQRSMVTLRGASADFKTATDGVFTPHAQFEADIYIEKLNPEMKRASAEDSPEETGRVLITGLIPNWDKNMFRVEFVAPKENDIANHIIDNYHANETATIRGDLVTIKTEAAASANNNNWFGKPREAAKTTTFRRERVISGGSAVSIPSGEPGSITSDEVREGLAVRETKVAASIERSKNAAPKAPTLDSVGVAPVDPVAGKQVEDFDF